MIFAKLDVCFWSHEKFVRVGPAAAGYWAAVLAYLREHETKDGVIPFHVIGMIWGVGVSKAKDFCEKLVGADLFALRNHGYELLGYSLKNETKEDIEERRAETAKRVGQLRSRRRGQQSGPMVYFAELPSNGSIKIGTSTNVGDRIAQLRSEFKEPVRLLASAPGNEIQERAYHARFQVDHIAGEWFEPSAGLLGLVSELSNVAHQESSNAVTRIKNPSRVPGSPSVLDPVAEIQRDPDISTGTVDPESSVRLQTAEMFEAAPPEVRFERSNENQDGCFGDAVRMWHLRLHMAAKRPITYPTGGELTKLLAAFRAHAPDINTRADWAEQAGHEFGLSGEPTLNVHKFADWLDRGRKTAKEAIQQPQEPPEAAQARQRAIDNSQARRDASWREQQAKAVPMPVDGLRKIGIKL